MGEVLQAVAVKELSIMSTYLLLGAGGGGKGMGVDGEIVLFILAPMEKKISNLSCSSELRFKQRQRKTESAGDRDKGVMMVVVLVGGGGGGSFPKQAPFPRDVSIKREDRRRKKRKRKKETSQNSGSTN